MSDRCLYCAQSADVICMCSSAFLCSRCIQIHTQEPRQHDFKALRSTSLPQDLCEKCQETAGNSVCLCRFPPILLCAECFESHSYENPGQRHNPEPIHVRHMTRSQKDVECFQGRSLLLTQITHYLDANFIAVDQCKAGIELMGSQLIEEISLWMKKKTADLDKIRGELQEKVTELRSNMENFRFTHYFQPDSVFGQFLREAPYCNLKKKLTLFNHEIRPRALDQFLTDSVSWSFDSILMNQLLDIAPKRVSPTLPLIFYRSLRRFSLIDLSETNEKLSSKTHINDGTSLCVLPNGDVFACGGEYPVHKLVYIIDAQGSKTVSQPDLSVARRAAGVVFAENSVWVFGGNDGKKSLAHSENYRLDGCGSDLLEDMLEPREKFTPCYWRNSLILAGGIGSTRIEQFDLQQRTYTRLDVELPVADSTTTIVRGDELAILQDNQFLVCNLGAANHQVELKTQIPRGGWWSNIQPVPYQGNVFFFRLDFNLLFDRGLVDVLVSSLKKVVKIHRASLYALELDSLQLLDLRSIDY